MEERPAMKDLFCELCSLQFGGKKVYEIHQSIIHGKRKIEEEPSLDIDSLASFGESIVFEEKESKDTSHLLCKQEVKEEVCINT